jgi:hypothetical protein
MRLDPRAIPPPHGVIMDATMERTRCQPGLGHPCLARGTATDVDHSQRARYRH